MKRMILLATFSSLLFSCKKEKEEIKFAHTGTWKFAGATATHSDTYVDTSSFYDYDSIVSVYSTGYSCFNGTLDITATAWNFSDAQYTFQETVETSTYANGSIIRNVETRNNERRAGKYSMKCKMINADSVYFYNTEIAGNPTYFMPYPIYNTGATVTVSGDTMLVHIVVDHYKYGFPQLNTRPGRLDKTITYVR